MKKLNLMAMALGLCFATAAFGQEPPEGAPQGPPQGPPPGQQGGFPPQGGFQGGPPPGFQGQGGPGQFQRGPMGPMRPPLMGPMLLLRNDVKKELKLSEEQVKKIRALAPMAGPGGPGGFGQRQRGQGQMFNGQGKGEVGPEMMPPQPPQGEIPP